MFSTVLGATYVNNEYKFITNKESTREPYKSPMDMFEDKLIDNDLEFVDKTICEYCGIDR